MTVIGNVAGAPRLLLTVMVPGFVSLISPGDHQGLELRSHADLPSVQAVPQDDATGLWLPARTRGRNGSP
jgi:hypothetical protein